MQLSGQTNHPEMVLFWVRKPVLQVYRGESFLPVFLSILPGIQVLNEASSFTLQKQTGGAGGCDLEVENLQSVCGTT